jgi:hypothetical protein
LARYVFGAVVKRAVEQRREALRRLGVEPDDPNRSAKRRERERRAVGGEIAARSRQTFLPTAPDVFRGRVQLGDAGAPGAGWQLEQLRLPASLASHHRSLPSGLGLPRSTRARPRQAATQPVESGRFVLCPAVSERPPA